MGFFGHLLQCLPNSRRSTKTAKSPIITTSSAPFSSPATTQPPSISPDAYEYPPRSTDRPPILPAIPSIAPLTTSPVSTLLFTEPSEITPTTSPTPSPPLPDAPGSRRKLSKLAPPHSISLSLSPATPIDGPPNHTLPLPYSIRPPSPTQPNVEEPPRQDTLSPDLTPTQTGSTPLDGAGGRGSPNLSVHTPSSPRSPYSHHRRTSSTGSRRSFRETLNAFSVDAGDGTRNVNQYILEKELGKGSYATVQLATDRETGEKYAVKVFSKERLKKRAANEAMRNARGKGGRARGPRGPSQEAAVDPDLQGPRNLGLVREEVAIMKKLNHPNLATVHEVIDVTSDDALLVVMELCAGGPITKVSLESTAEPIPEEKARHIFGQLVMGLAYLHHNHVVHRDIKPDNALFMADKETVKIVDFGISEMFQKDDDIVEKSVGSPAFMAPELVSNDHEHKHGYACDVWSLGVTLFALVTGRLPFAKVSPIELYASISKDEVEYPFSLSPELISLLKRLLAKNSDERITVKAMWDDPWVTDHGSEPLIPYDENCSTPDDPTPLEVDNALLSFHHKVLVARAANKFRKGTLAHKRSVSDQAAQSTVMVEPTVTLTSEPESCSSLSLPSQNVQGQGKDETKEKEKTSLPVMEFPLRKDTSSSFQTLGSESSKTQNSTPASSERGKS